MHWLAGTPNTWCGPAPLHDHLPINVSYSPFQWEHLQDHLHEWREQQQRL
jgi:hypothetical protein